ncbi:MAG: hypothetical protein ACUVX9_16740 [Anaerolineae bacterium]
MIKQTRTSNENVLLLDAGNSLISQSPSDAEPAKRTKAQTSVEILNRLGYDAVALGPLDLLLGKDELQKRLSEAKGFDWLSANLSDAATGKPIAKPYVIREIDTHPVALIGITGPMTGTLRGRAPEFTIGDPLQAAADAVREVRGRADIIILLSSAGADLNKEIAAQVPGIDLILSAGPQPLPEPLEAPAGVLVAQPDYSSPGHAGRTVGILQLDYDRNGQLLGHKWNAVQLNEYVGDDPELASWVADIKQP